MPRFMRSMLERVRAQLELSVLQSDAAVAERQFLKRTAKLERKRREASQTFLAMMSRESCCLALALCSSRACSRVGIYLLALVHSLVILSFFRR